MPEVLNRASMVRPAHHDNNVTLSLSKGGFPLTACGNDSDDNVQTIMRPLIIITPPLSRIMAWFGPFGLHGTIYINIESLQIIETSRVNIKVDRIHKHPLDQDYSQPFPWEFAGFRWKSVASTMPERPSKFILSCFVAEPFLWLDFFQTDTAPYAKSGIFLQVLIGTNGYIRCLL